MEGDGPMNYQHAMPIVAAVAALTLGACGSRPAAPAVRVSPAGLGDTLTALTKVYGKPTSEPIPLKDGHGVLNFRADLTVEFLSGRVDMMQAEMTHQQAIAGALQTWNTRLAPSDARNLGSEPSANGSVFLFQSAKLAKEMPAKDFVGGKPGTYTVAQDSSGGDVVLTYAIGNNP